MLKRERNDDLVMDLVHSALSRAPEERERFVREACADDTSLFEEVWSRVEWESKMKGFLLEPVLRPAEMDVPFKPGDLLDGRFRIIREVARGGMGIVFEAHDAKLDRRIALKCAKFAHRGQLAGEVRNASEVSHPNVCKIFELHTVFTHAGEVDFITMEFLEGETLAARLKRGPMAEVEARTVVRQLAAGLAEAHRNHVIHGDFKSNNVILTKGPGGELRAVITDFGLARQRDSAVGAKFDGPTGGTPGYMAPEIVRGEKASVASDIYALGVVMFEMLAGHRPDQTADDAVSMSGSTRTLATGEVAAVLPARVKTRWDRAIARCLDADPVKRFASADQVFEALGPSRTRRYLLAAAGVAIVAAAATLVTYQRATAPASNVRVTIGDFQAAAGAEAAARALARDTGAAVSKLKSSKATRFVFVPGGERDGATHVLHGSVAPAGDSIDLRAVLTDARTGVNKREWKARYSPENWRYAPAALAALTTATFDLPAAPDYATVNAAAEKDYRDGIAFLRRVSKTDAALESFTRAVAADPESALTHAGLAEAQWFKYFGTRDKSWLDRAAESVRQAELRNLDLAPVHRISGLLKGRAGWYEQAEADFRRAIELEPGNSDAYRRLGFVYQQNNEMDKALGAYRAALELDPSDYRNHQQMGSFHDVQSKYGEAAVHFRKAVEIAPDEPEPHRALGNAYSNMGRFSEAEAELRAVLKLAETPIALHSLGVALMYQQRDREAIPYMRRAIDIGPERFLWWTNLATAYRRAGQAVESKDACQRALKLAEVEMQKNPRDGYVRSILAYVVAQMGDGARAESEIAQALRLAPGDADVRFFAACTYETLKRRDDAMATLSASPAAVIADVSRWPDLADLRKDSRFQTLLATQQSEKGEK